MFCVLTALLVRCRREYFVHLVCSVIECKIDAAITNIFNHLRCYGHFPGKYGIGSWFLFVS